MTTMIRVCAALLVSMGLAACGAADDEPRKPPRPVEETVFRDVAVTPLEKARNVENVVMEQKRATDRALESNEGGGDQ
jgi:hypothetical protein